MAPLFELIKCDILFVWLNVQWNTNANQIFIARPNCTHDVFDNSVFTCIFGDSTSLITLQQINKTIWSVHYFICLLFISTFPFVLTHSGWLRTTIFFCVSHLNVGVQYHKMAEVNHPQRGKKEEITKKRWSFRLKFSSLLRCGITVEIVNYICRRQHCQFYVGSDIVFCLYLSLV